MADGNVAALRARFAEHNRRVALLVLLTLMVAAGMWAMLYVALYWLTILVLTVIHGIDATPPAGLPSLYIYTAALFVLLCWLARKLTPHPLPRDRISLGGTLLDLLLALPRATLAIWGNLSAWQRLTDTELELASSFLARLARERRVPLQSVPVDIPDRKARMRILLGLQLIELLQVRRHQDTTWLSLARNHGLRLPE
ncbi:MAG: hypothetical protein M3463_08520 [Verrucomicrobiota bacterium]|nr:hypothetical protein [Verrucomicrobiota bacterium]